MPKLRVFSGAELCNFLKRTRLRTRAAARQSRHDAARPGFFSSSAAWPARPRHTTWHHSSKRTSPVALRITSDIRGSPKAAYRHLRLASGRGEALRPSFFIHPFSPISSFILSSARFILLNSYFILSSPSAIFRAFMPPPTELNAVAAPAPAKETSANAQARVALSDPRRGGDLSIGRMELN